MFIWGDLNLFLQLFQLHLKSHIVILSPYLHALALLFRFLCDVQCFGDVFFILWVILPDWFYLQFGFKCCFTFLFICLPWFYSPFRSSMTWAALPPPTALRWVNVFVFFPPHFLSYLRPYYFPSDLRLKLLL